MTVLRVGADIEIALLPDETIMAGLYREGYSYRIGCRRGGCGICKVDLVEGAVDYPTTVAPQVLSDEERRTGTCLSCRAVPRGDIQVALRADRLYRNPLLAHVRGSRRSSTIERGDESCP